MIQQTAKAHDFTVCGTLSEAWGLTKTINWKIRGTLLIAGFLSVILLYIVPSVFPVIPNDWTASVSHKNTVIVEICYVIAIFILFAGLIFGMITITLKQNHNRPMSLTTIFRNFTGQYFFKAVGVLLSVLLIFLFFCLLFFGAAYGLVFMGFRIFTVYWLMLGLFTLFMLLKYIPFIFLTMGIMYRKLTVTAQ